jgi:chemotaxis protein CheX
MFKAELINPFLESACNVLASIIETEVDKSDANVCISSMTAQEVNVIIGIFGNVHGHIIYGMSSATAKHIAAKMIGRPVKTLNPLAQSAIGELGNMITGNAIMGIEESYPDVELKPPVLFLGKKIIISSAERKRLNVYLDSEVGTIEVGISFFEDAAINTLKIIHQGKPRHEHII